MTQPQDKMRAEFEEFCQTSPAVPDWARNDVYDPETPKYPGEYRDMYVQMMWCAWQAACAQQSAQSQQDAMQPLTESQVLDALRSITNEPPARLPPGWIGFARAIERAHGITPIATQGASNV